MACFSPLTAYRGKTITPGKINIVWDRKQSVSLEPLRLPCGQCVGCRLERSRQWAIRCVHEASLYDDNCFLTLTFDEEHFPPSGSLDKADFQNFMKRFRKKCGKRIRYYHCGEYGEQFGRPHYHAIIFNYDFSDKELHSEKNGHKVYTSKTLSELWPFGFSLIGSVTFDSAAYVARYIMKKINGDMAEAHYDGKEPEYTTMSRRPGIGKGWYEKWKDDVFPSDEVIIKGVACKPPRFYEIILDKENKLMYADVKRERKRNANHADDNVFRDRVKEEVVKSKIQTLIRPLEVSQ